ncbi:unnamed protein product, partial [Urochloa humidicola]
PDIADGHRREPRPPRLKTDEPQSSHIGLGAGAILAGAVVARSTTGCGHPVAKGSRHRRPPQQAIVAGSAPLRHQVALPPSDPQETVTPITADAPAPARASCYDVCDGFLLRRLQGLAAATSSAAPNAPPPRRPTTLGVALLSSSRIF